jgi:hypothetical protein
VEKGAPTTTVVFPNLERIGYGNESVPGIGNGLSIMGLYGETSNLTTISFPALTSIPGEIEWPQVNPLMTNVTGFPVLASVGDVLSSGVGILGQFASLAFPALTSVGAGIIIESTDPSFRCPSNIVPKIVPSGDCVVCEYMPTLNLAASGTCNSQATQTTASPTATGAGTNSAATGKASGASTLNRAGNQFYQMGLIYKGCSIYATVLLSWGLLHFGLIWRTGRLEGRRKLLISELFVVIVFWFHW